MPDQWVIGRIGGVELERPDCDDWLAVGQPIAIKAVGDPMTLPPAPTDELSNITTTAGSRATLDSGRFDLLSLLKHGNGVDTYAGVDNSDGAPVIVKTVDTDNVSTAVRMRLEHEAHVLERLDTGKFRRVLGSGWDGNIFYLVQPQLEGQSLRERLTQSPLSVRSTLSIAFDILDILQLAHEQGVLHRDIKPSNIIVRGAESVETADLIDFGLARSGELDATLRDEPVGTVRYLAPESAGLIRADVDQRSDLYSLGVVLFECLAGEPPFHGDTVGEVLRQHLNTPAPQLRSMGVAVPRALDGVLQRMLAKDPRVRYQSAASVLADITELSTGLSAGIVEPAMTLGLHDRLHVLTEPSFVGRAEELANLAEHLNRAASGHGGLVLVEAESGEGKTRLLDELALQAGRRDFWVLHGQGVDQAALRPFQVLDRVVADIVAAESDTSVEHGLRRRLGHWAEAAVAALPALGATLGEFDQDTLGPEAYGETRNIDALTALLDALGQENRPVLVLLDDCQWADSMTIALLGKWQADRTMAGHRFVLLVAAFRSQEVSSGHALRSLDPLTTVVLKPFDTPDIEALCTSMAGPLPASAISNIVRLADGSPFMASAIVRGMVETGALRDSAEGWEIDPVPMHDVQTSRRAAAFLSQRLDQIAPETLRLLKVGALLGKEFDLVLAVSLTGQTASEVTPALDDARRRRILWVEEGESRCSFTHDKLREALLRRLDPNERMTLHGRAAARIEIVDPDRIFEIAYHFDAAGDPERALPYAIRAAELARSRHALDAAVTHYRIAERAMSAPDAQPDDALLASIAEGLGDVLTLQGDYAEAAKYLEQALSVTSDAIGRSVIDGKLGNLAFKCGDQAKARRYLEGALRDLGRWVPRNGPSAAIATAVQVFVQALHSIAPRLFLARRTLEGSESEFVAIRMYSRLAYVYWFSAGRIPCAWAHLREMNLAERYPPTPELAQAYSEHAPVMTMVPWYSRGSEYAMRSLEIRRELGDVWGQGQSLNFYGTVLYASSRYRECIEACRESVRLLERTGDRWEQNTATWHQVFSYYRLGELDTAVEMARELYYSASAIGDVTAAGIALSGWSRSGAGTVPEAFITVELGRDLGDAQTAAEVRLADGVRLLSTGELDRAVERLEEADSLVAGAGLRQEYVAPVKPWLATALRMLVEATDSHQPRTRSQLLRRAARAARAADHISRSYRNNRPHALRERALVAELQGRPARARRFLDRSLAVANEQGANYEAILTRVSAARLASVEGRPGAEAEFDDAEAERAALEPHLTKAPHPTLSLADRFESLLDVGRQIGAASSPAAVYLAVHDAAVQLLRGDRCHVIKVGEGCENELITESGDPVKDLSTSVLAQAITLQAPVVSGAVPDADLGDSLLLADLRSILCAPILSDGKVVACFYVTHHLVNGLFGDDEVQLAEFIATLAGAALDHVAGSEAHFRSLAQNSSDVITIVNPEGAITYQSSSVERVFGYAPGELVGHELASWLHPGDAEELLVFLDLSNRGKEANGLVQTRMRHRDGTWRVGESAVRNLYDDPGVRGLVLNTRDASERVALESELRNQAMHDPLTGLANRALFVDRVDNALARRVRDQRPLAILFLDLDDFKLVNDTLGHGTGDLLLKQTGERLEKCVRPGDLVARFGGDEFALLLENADVSASAAIAERIIAEFVRPYEILEQEVFTRASVGVAIARGNETSDELLSGADSAMYVAKSRGKARFEFYESEMRDAAVDRSALRTDLEWAVQRGELAIDYQPLVDLPTGTLSGFEALVRWNHPTRGRLGPDQFIDLAEENGTIIPLGSWVLRNACKQIAVWQRTQGREFTIAVNMSARQLQDPGLIAKIQAALAASGISANALILEITESATVEDTERSIEVLNSLKTLGVRLAIDDFGTGYSSLSYLRRFPVDQLKVDQSFVSELVTNPEDLAIVSSVINLGHSLGLSVVAEGVETVDQLEKLCDMGCDQAQGFKWRRPADAQDVSSWLDSLAGEAALA
jgi:two-component system sensor kinase